MFGSGMHPLDLAKQTTLIIPDEEMNDIMKIVKSCEESGLLIKGASETVERKRRISWNVIRHFRG